LPFQTESTAPDTLEALGAAIDLRDGGTEGHSRRVCRFALQIAKAMGLSEAQHKTIAMGAYLHTESGRLYDPQVTAAFFSLPKETWPAIARMQHQVTSLPSWLRSGGAAGPIDSTLSSPRT
jgi:response regulator RpfG family c-di-GMP phosphodiesterase